MFKTDHKLWKSFKSDQYSSSSETGMCWVYWAAFASLRPPRLSSTATQTVSAPRAGAVSLVRTLIALFRPTIADETELSEFGYELTDPGSGFVDLLAI
jgi:hypothetical protein